MSAYLTIYQNARGPFCFGNVAYRISNKYAAQSAKGKAQSVTICVTSHVLMDMKVHRQSLFFKTRPCDYKTTLFRKVCETII